EEATRAVRAAERARDVAADLREAEDQQRAAHWAEARAAVERALGRLADGGDEELRQRAERARGVLDQVRADQEPANRLEEARLQSAVAGPGSSFGNEAARQAYRSAFVEYGIDPEKLAPAEAARRIRESQTRDLLVAALDDWAAQPRTPD